LEAPVITPFSRLPGFLASVLDGAIETLADARTWALSDGFVGLLDCGGSARTLTLPAEASASQGVFYFKNMSDNVDELLTIVDDAAGAVTTVPAGGSVVLYCTSTAWQVVQRDSNLHRIAKTRTLSGNHTLTTADQRFQVLDPGGAGRNVVLPAEASMAGDFFVIVNSADAAETLTVQDNDASTTVLTVAQNFGAYFFSTGAGWIAFRFAQT
jgi:hypothetical protein